MSNHNTEEKVNRLRTMGRAWPFKTGRSEIKKFLGRGMRGPLPPVQILPGLKLCLGDLNSHNRVFWWHEEMAAALMFYLMHYFPVSGTFLDVGSSTGIMGFLAARLKSARVIAFEPQPANCALIRQTMGANPWMADFELIELPCSSSGDARFPGMDYKRLDDTIGRAGWGFVDLLKIDTDGHDMDALGSLGSRLCGESVGAIFIEMGTEKQEAYRFIQSRGYEGFSVNRTKLPELLRRGINQTERDWFRKLPASADQPECPPWEDVLWVAKDRPLCGHLNRQAA